MNSRMASPALRRLGTRLLSSSSIRPINGEPVHRLLTGLAGNGSAVPVRSGIAWMKLPEAGVRFASSVSVGAEREVEEEKATAGGQPPEEKRTLNSYWGVAPAKIVKEDGTEWKWKSFRPWETYEPDLSIDLKKHHVPTTILDKIAYWTVKSLRLPTDIFFQVNACHA